jgi:hypothetical protein
MLIFAVCGLILLGSMVESAIDLAVESYRAQRAANDLSSLRGMIDGSECFIAERYLRIRSDLIGHKKIA